MAVPSLLTRLFSSRQLAPAAIQLAQHSRKELLKRSESFTATSIPELRGYIRARALPVIERVVKSYLANEGRALAGYRDALLRQALEVATEQTLIELRQAQRHTGRRWKAA